MIKSKNFPLDNSLADALGGWNALKQKLDILGLDGIEGIWSGREIPEDFPSSLLTGYHWTFFLDWLDFYRGRKDIVRERYQDIRNIELAFGGPKPEDLMETYRKDLERARKLNASYLVFHVSNVSFEECYTYHWNHSDEEVIDASVEILNELLKDVEPTFDLLVENQWWPGFRFTDPSITEHLLSGIRYPRKGIMLDTGHLMNTNTRIRSQKDGIRYVHEMMDLHGELSFWIKGVHFHQSLSGRYTQAHTGFLPEYYPDTYLEQFNVSYGHILQIDLHMPWTDPECVTILERVQPLYLTHELSGGIRSFGKAARQIHTIRRGGFDFV